MVAKFAQKTSKCWLCSAEMPAGTEIWPLEETGRAPELQTKFRWSHLECARKQRGTDSGKELIPPLCPFFARRGTCLHGEGCFFRHGEGNPESDTSAFGKSSKKQEAHTFGKTSTFGKNSRAGVFRRWLIEHFWDEELKHSGHDRTVLDIAGGKGEVSFELARLNGVACTVFDPQELMLIAFFEKMKLGRYHCNKLLTTWNAPTYLADAARSQNGAGELLPPIRHVRAFFDHALIRWFKGEEEEECEPVDAVCPIECATIAKDYVLGANSKQIADSVLNGDFLKTQKYKQVRGTFPRMEKFGEDPDAFHDGNSLSTAASTPPHSDGTPSHRDEADLLCQLCNSISTCNSHRAALPAPSLSVTTDAAVHSLLQNTSLVIGMHLDGAAEAAVDFALALNVSFAIVPCCTCSKDFPSRRLDGKVVRKYEELVEYLTRKDPRIRKDALDFEGRNLVLWMKV